MTVKRYGLRRDLLTGYTTMQSGSGRYVLFIDHEADKAEAVEKATAELRAELVALLEDSMWRQARRRCDGWWESHAGRPFSAGERLIGLGVWQGCLDHGDTTLYRPVEPRDSGGSDE